MEIGKWILVLAAVAVCAVAQVPGQVQNLDIPVSSTRQWGFMATWDPPTSGSDPVSYILTVSRLNAQGAVYTATYTPTDSCCSYDIDRLQADESTTYELSVVAVDADGESGPPSTADVTLAEFRLTERSTDSLTIAWNVTDDSNNYSIEYTAVGSGVSTTVNVTAGAQSYELTGLSAGTEYDIDLFISGTSSLAATGTFRTVPLQVSGLTADTTTDSSITLSWDRPEGGVEMYRVEYDPDWGSMPPSSNTGDTTFTLQGLDPGQEYEVTVTTLVGDDESEGTVDTFSTESGSSGAIQARAITDNSVTVTWSPVTTAESYTVSISPADASSITVQANERRYAEFTGLSEGSAYTVTVVANLPVGTSMTTLEVQTTPSVPGPITVTNILPRFADLSWGASSGADVYEVTLSSDNGEDLIRTEETSLSLEDLEPETTYTVSVVATSTQQSIDTRSGERRENFTTTAVVISLSQIGSTSVLVIGTQTAFTLTYTPNDGDFQSGSNAEADQTLLSSLTPSQGYEVSIQNGSMTIDRINFFTSKFPV
ncbi:fibronectin-like [Diadema antillarum]|uniref:fibronectin-like n=1 Tax=Diadema antillarum TaxID=105358 RepID=UPI003A854DC1